jgi:predicted SAM-dependent methyltransferase
MKLHLGCGKRNFGDDWYHVDSERFDHVSDHDIFNLSIPDKSADLIYSSHMIEYLDREDVNLLLQSWAKKLKSGGTLRLAVPDFESMSKLYSSGKIKLRDILGPLYGKMTSDGKTIYHRTVYDLESLREVLEQNGFKNVRRYDWRVTEHANFDDHSQAYFPKMDKENGTLISLNVECEKI